MEHGQGSGIPSSLPHSTGEKKITGPVHIQGKEIVQRHEHQERAPEGSPWVCAHLAQVHLGRDGGAEGGSWRRQMLSWVWVING